MSEDVTAAGDAAADGGERAVRPRRGRRRATRPGTGTGASGRSADDADVGWGEAGGPDVREGQHERWLHEQRPPHWG